MRLAFPTACVALLALSTTACTGSQHAKRGEQGDDTANLTPASHYYPLGVGSRWSYTVTDRAEPVVIELVGVEGGYHVDQRGAKLGVDEIGINDGSRYLLQNPVRTGTQWRNVVSATATEHYRILSTLTPCEVPAGAFDDCTQVESRQRVDDSVTLVNTMTFARGVGLVRAQVVAETPSGKVPQSTLELSDFELKTDAAPVD